MLFTTNLSLLLCWKHLRSCQFTGVLVAFNFSHVWNLCEKTTLPTDYHFFTESLATTATMQHCIIRYALNLMSCQTEVVLLPKHGKTTPHISIHFYIRYLLCVDCKVSQLPLTTSLHRLIFYDLSTFQCHSTHYQPARHRWFLSLKENTKPETPSNAGFKSQWHIFSAILM